MTTPNPLKTEAQWFYEREREIIEEQHREREKRLAELLKAEEDERTIKLREAHWLKCPKCGHDMKSLQLEGIELEQCTFCEGIYFDRGELDSFLMRRTAQRFKFYRRLFGLD
jgi:hypothetical protein